MKSLLAFAVLCLLASTSHASSMVSCGTGEPNEELSYGANQELQISSGDDQYEGQVDGTWSLKLKTQADWMKATPAVTAKTTKNEEGATVITVRMIQAQGMGPVGIQYVLTDLYSDTPTLEKYAIGGFAGGSKVGTYNCISVID